MNKKILFLILFVFVVLVFIFSSILFYNNKTLINESVNLSPVIPVVVYTPEIIFIKKIPVVENDFIRENRITENKFIGENHITENKFIRENRIIEDKFVYEKNNNYSLTSMLYDNELNSTDVFITLSFNTPSMKLTCSKYTNITHQIVQYTDVALFLFNNTSCSKSRPIYVEYTLPSGKIEKVSHLISYEERKFYFNFS